MTEFLGGKVPPEQGDEYVYPDGIESLGLGPLGATVISSCGDTTEHYHEESGASFRAAKWNDDGHEAGRHYILQQDAVHGGYAYILQVVAPTGSVTEWYRFQSYSTSAWPCNEKDGTAKSVTAQEMNEANERAIGYMRGALARLPGFTMPLAPADVVRGAKLSRSDNEAFINLAVGYVLAEIPAAKEVFMHLRTLPEDQLTEANAETLVDVLTTRRLIPGGDMKALMKDHTAYLQLPSVWVIPAVRQVLQDLKTKS